jgi:ferredoxin
MYDAPGDKTQVTFEDEMGREISMLVRCNEVPEELLIEEGRALPPLTEEQRDDVSQLVTYNEDDSSVQVSEFFRNAIAVMFREHAITNDEDKTIMKAAGVASWMSKSLGSHVSAHDKRVLSLMTRFAEYGTGYLTADNFDQVYLAAVRAALDGSNVKVSRNTGLKGQPTIESIWIDIRNHNILSPVEAEREIKMLEIRKLTGELNALDTPFQLNSQVMDECEILEDGQSYATSTFQTSWSDVKKKELSSHELVEKAADGKTPLYLRDGEFIFIDEESCIGCIQCATVAPSSFLMLDHGRARTYQQRNDPDVKAAVATCPVSCMHKVSFDELTEMENARENGDGRSDHKHCGSSKGYTPLHVSRRGTDANKKDSWYHYLKQKCFRKSSQSLLRATRSFALCFIISHPPC